MTKEQAKQVLRANGYCETHGVRLVEEKVNKQWSRHTIDSRYCPTCRMEASKERQSDVQEAISVLGLGR